MSDLVTAASLGQLDAVMAGGHLAGRLRELPQRPDEPARQVQPQQTGDDHSTAESDAQPLDERHGAAVELRVRLRNDERTEEVVAELERPGDGKVSLAFPPDVDRRRATCIERAHVDRARKQL